MFAVALAILLAASVSHAAETLHLKTLDGSGVEVREGSADAIVLHFWATWCPSCKEELGVLDRAAAGCDPAQVRVIAVDVGEAAPDVRRWLADRPLALAVLLDPSGKAWRSGGGRELPANWIWHGGERRWSFGPSTASAWRERLAALGCAPIGTP